MELESNNYFPESCRLFIITMVAVFKAVSCLAGTNDIFIITDITNASIWTATIVATDTVDTFEFSKIPLKNLVEPAAVGYDYFEKRVYWTDIGKETINRAFSNGTGEEMIANSASEGIAIDVENRHIYWTDKNSKSILKANLNGTEQETILDIGLDVPMDIIVDPAGRLLYWSDVGAPPKIEKASFDGTDRVILVETDLMQPNGIVLDFEDERLFWCDAGTNKIETTDFNGGNRETLFAPNNPDISPYNIGIYDNDIYWTDWVLPRLVKINKYAGQTAQSVGTHSFIKAGGLHIHRENDGSCTRNLCENESRCRQLTNGYQCACLRGFSGMYCNIDVRVCNSDPCLHGGLCSNEINGFSCYCTSTSWTGRTCELDFNECEKAVSSMCHENAECVNTPGSYHCQCLAGFDGDGVATCTDIDECLSSPCRHDGTCHDLINQYTCTCDSRYDGVNCNRDFDECASSPCQNGATCFSALGYFQCNCATGYDGERCDLEVGCRHPGALENGYVTPDPEDKYMLLPGETMEFICKKGYSLVGQKDVFCQADTTWSHDEVHVCIVDKKAGNMNTVVAASLGAGGGVVAVLVIVVLIVYFRKSPKRPPKNERNPATDQRPLPHTPDDDNDTSERIPPTKIVAYGTVVDQSTLATDGQHQDAAYVQPYYGQHQDAAYARPYSHNTVIVDPPQDPAYAQPYSDNSVHLPLRSDTADGERRPGSNGSGDHFNGGYADMSRKAPSDNSRTYGNAAIGLSGKEGTDKTDMRIVDTASNMNLDMTNEFGYVSHDNLNKPEKVVLYNLKLKNRIIDIE